MKNLPANLRKLLEWLDRVSPLPEAQIVAAALDHTLDKALMQNFAEMNLCNATVSITARRPGSPTISPRKRSFSIAAAIAAGARESSAQPNAVGVEKFFETPRGL